MLNWDVHEESLITSRTGILIIPLFAAHIRLYFIFRVMKYSSLNMLKRNEF